MIRPNGAARATAWRAVSHRRGLISGADFPPPDQGTTTNINDPSLDHYLAAGALCPTVSEAHGVLCGLLCGGAPEAEALWLGQLAPEPDAAAGIDAGDAAEAQRALSGLARETREAIEDSELGFQLLLPDDSRPLAERALALYDWVRGFLYAWGTLAPQAQEPSAEVREVIEDFTDITRMDLQELDDDDQNEEAFAEVSEFVRIAAILIHQERVLGQRAEWGPRA
jgi:uncharacterized protein YgfB (UPF0149 family)